jgi:hypothetical protein
MTLPHERVLKVTESQVLQGRGEDAAVSRRVQLRKESQMLSHAAVHAVSLMTLPHTCLSLSFSFFLALTM